MSENIEYFVSSRKKVLLELSERDLCAIIGALQFAVMKSDSEFSTLVGVETDEVADIGEKLVKALVELQDLDAALRSLGRQ